MIDFAQLAPQQRTVITARKQYILIYGGVGTYKTTACLLRTYLHCRQFPGQYFCVLAPTYQQLMSTYFEEWKRQIPDDEWSYNSKNETITLPKFRSQIRLHYADHKESAKRLRSMNLTGYHIIQAESVENEELFHELEKRVRLKEGVSKGFESELNPHPYHLKLIDANAGHPSHWVNQLFIDKQSERYFANDLITRIRVRTTSETSIYNEETIELWRKNNARWLFQRMVEGEWVGAEGRIYDDYQTFKHPSDKVLDYCSKYDRIFLGCDQGQTDPTMIVFIGYANGIYEVFDEIKAIDPIIADLVKIATERMHTWGLSNRKLLMWVDPAARQLCTEWNAIKSPIQAFQSKHKGSDPVLNRTVKLKERFRTKQLIVSDFCVNLLKDLECTVWKDKSDGVIDKQRYNPHAIDALGYAMVKEAF